MNINLKKIESIAIITIDRPKSMNALNKKISEKLNEAIEMVSSDAEIRALVFYSPENFAAGADIKEMVDLNEDQAAKFSFSPVFNKIEQLEIPTIAAIDGYALGGGLELALACDLRLASKEAIMGFPEINLGIMPGAGGTIRLPRLVGESKAKELILLGETIGAEAAMAIGLINRVVAKEELYKAALNLAEKVAQKAPIAVRHAKKTINEGLTIPTKEEAVKMEASNWVMLFHTEDQKEGMKAFIEKRPPVYQGK